ncbi:hypothetical protein OPV22_025229 [Ensete ventricosum]|uniref:Cyclin-like domain-containing protein n=1 Tax=Ensete ventricosum TaxID=4639 RepID=A0AAV8Q6U6_ENSVE|nr:hypothetical protein OPV22_025229 [Ensete ventricosum]
MDEPGCSRSISGLLCQEDATGIDLDLDSPTDESELSQAFLVLKATDLCEEEYVEKLVSRESSFERQNSDFCLVPTTESWLKRARSDAIQWILKTRACFGFGFRTAFLAATYFDRFLARRRIDKEKPWAVRLLSMACLSVAAKMEEYRAPLLSELQIHGYAFDSNAVQRMELLLLDTLQWRMDCVTPFEYLSYFRCKFRCDADDPEESLRNVTALIFAAVDVINLATSYCSFTIAAAAILAASSSTYTKELMETKMSGIPLFGSSSEKENVFSCYNTMTQHPPKNMRSPKRSASPGASESCSSITGVSDGASFGLPRNKRRRLQLPDTH